MCRAVVTNYLNNVGKGKKISPPIVFQGGVSKNVGVIQAFEDAVGYPITVDENSHLIGALGAAILLASRTDADGDFRFDIAEIDFTTRGVECGKLRQQLRDHLRVSGRRAAGRVGKQVRQGRGS